MRKCVSYSYFSSPASVYHKIKDGCAARQFEQFLPLLVRAHHTVWPHYWHLDIHHDNAVMELPYFKTLLKFNDAGLLRLVPMGPVETLCEAMFWRMKPIWEGYDVVVIRDIDSILSPQDFMAVQEFIDSELATHVIHSAAAHSGMMGGTLAVRSKSFIQKTNYQTWEIFKDACRNVYPKEKWDVQGCDQHFLNQFVLPKVRDSLLLHELHHSVKDMGVPEHNIRRTVAERYIGYGKDFVAEMNAQSPGIGICTEPAPALKFYDSVNTDVIQGIRICESQ